MSMTTMMTVMEEAQALVGDRRPVALRVQCRWLEENGARCTATVVAGTVAAGVQRVRAAFRVHEERRILTKATVVPLQMGGGL